jgi:hypothetical protein
MPAPKVSPEEKARALEIYQGEGAAEASRQTGIPRATISKWASRAGVTVSPERHEKLSAAVQAAQLTLAERRSRLAIDLMTEAETERGRLRQAVTERRVSASGRLVEWTEDEPSPSDRRAIATTAAILIDKSLLLSGEATTRGRLDVEATLHNGDRDVDAEIDAAIEKRIRTPRLGPGDQGYPRLVGPEPGEVAPAGGETGAASA